MLVAGRARRRGRGPAARGGHLGGRAGPGDPGGLARAHGPHPAAGAGGPSCGSAPARPPRRRSGRPAHAAVKDRAGGRADRPPGDGAAYTLDEVVALRQGDRGRAAAAGCRKHGRGHPCPARRAAAGVWETGSGRAPALGDVRGVGGRDGRERNERRTSWRENDRKTATREAARARKGSAEKPRQASRQRGGRPLPRPLAGSRPGR